MTHAELAELVQLHGGDFVSFPRRAPLLLVVGDWGWPVERDGSPTRIFQRAQELASEGFAIEFVLEDEFLQRLGLIASAQSIHRLYTIGDLARILRVPPARLRRWVRFGMLTPVTSVHRLMHFDFHQAAFARRLSELLAQGVSLATIRSGLERLRRWLPDDKLPVAQVARLEANGRLLVRRGRLLLDTHGQQHFDFCDPGASDSVSSEAPPTLAGDFTPRLSIDQLFDAALAYEDEGRLEEAAAMYERAQAIEPADPVLHFNLGNVLFGLGRYEQAASSFQQALRFDPHYAEAWNNLGNVRSEQGNCDQAIAAFRQALQLVPDYSLAQANLDELLRSKAGGVATKTVAAQPYPRLAALT